MGHKAPPVTHTLHPHECWGPPTRQRPPRQRLRSGRQTAPHSPARMISGSSLPHSRPFDTIRRRRRESKSGARRWQCTHYERAPFLRRQSWLARQACGGFAPTPPGFGALVPLPIESFIGELATGGYRSIPLYRSRPLSRRSGCFPAWPYPPLSSEVIVLGRKNQDVRGGL
jgi:hypothetical protein